MKGLFLWILLSFCILGLGTICFISLLRRYRLKLLFNFSEKIQMTAALAVIFGLLFIAGIYLLPLYVDSIKERFPIYLKQPFLFAREGILFFLLNAFLILAVRRLIIVLLKSR